MVGMTERSYTFGYRDRFLIRKGISAFSEVETKFKGIKRHADADIMVAVVVGIVGVAGMMIMMMVAVVVKGYLPSTGVKMYFKGEDDDGAVMVVVGVVGMMMMMMTMGVEMVVVVMM